MDQRISENTTKKRRRLGTGCTENMQQLQDVVTQRIHPQEQVRQRPDQQFEGHEDDSYRIDSETGCTYCILATTTMSRLPAEFGRRPRQTDDHATPVQGNPLSFFNGF